MMRFVASLAAVLMVGCAGKTALLLVDVQDCFLESNTTSGSGGSLSVPASHILDKINQIRKDKSCLFDVVVRSQDFHPPNHISFGTTHGLAAFSHLGGKGALPLKCLTTTGATKSASCCPGWYLNKSAYDCSKVLCPPDNHVYSTAAGGLINGNEACTKCATQTCEDTTQAMWTDHCLQNGDSTFPPAKYLTTETTDIIVQKGSNIFVDAYSVFMDNTETLKTTLDSTLQSHKVDTLYVAGIATDVCVKWTVRDALGTKTGNYKVHLIKDATEAVLGSQTNFDAAVADMKGYGASIITTADVLATKCPTAVQTSNAESYKMGAFVWLLVFVSAWQFKFGLRD